MYDDEIWKPIEKIVYRDGREFFFEGYEVSNYGRVRSYKNKYGGVAAGGKRPMLKEPYIINGRSDSKGYVQYLLSDIYLKRRNFRGHTLVMQTFYGPPEDDSLVICHYDDVKHNNHVSNLRYDTQEANLADMKRNKAS